MIYAKLLRFLKLRSNPSRLFGGGLASLTANQALHPWTLLAVWSQNP